MREKIYNLILWGGAALTLLGVLTAAVSIGYAEGKLDGLDTANRALTADLPRDDSLRQVRSLLRVMYPGAEQVIVYYRNEGFLLSGFHITAETPVPGGDMKVKEELP